MDWSASGFEMWSSIRVSFEVLWTARHAQTTCWVTLLLSASASSQTGVEGTKQVWLQVPSSVRVSAQEFSAYIQNHLHTIWRSFPMLQLTRACAQEGLGVSHLAENGRQTQKLWGWRLNWLWPPQTQHEGHGQTPERLLGQIPTNINYFLTVADLCAIFYDSWKTCSSCKEQSVNLSKTRSGAAIVVKRKATNLSDKLHDMPIMEGLRLLLQRITHEDGTTGQETKPIYCYGFNHFTASN